MWKEKTLEEMEVVGEENVWLFPSWLPKLLGAEFYGRCEEHEWVECNFFCTCSEKENPTCCRICASSEAGDHGRHQHLQVYKASHRPGIPTAVMAKFAVIKDIQTYSINGFPVVYLRRKDDKTQYRHKRKCDYCGLDLKDDASHIAKFCSLECKLNFWKRRYNFLLQKLRSEEESMMVGRRGFGSSFQVVGESSSSSRPPETEKSGSTSSNSSSGPKTDVHSFRKKPRKGIPRRSPFF